MIPALPFEPMDIVEVYAEHDEPLLYLAKNARGESFLCVLAEDRDEEQVWFFAPMSEQRSEDVRAGVIDLHDAFALVENGTIIALHRSRDDHVPDRFEVLVAAEIDDACLPLAGERVTITRGRS